MKTIIDYAFALAEAVERLRERVRLYFYQVTLSSHTCPRCGGPLRMIREGTCECEQCSRLFDPTVAFQRCSECGSKVSLAVRRYRCSICGADVRSRFLFDGLVFDADYFSEKMAESRQRKRELREHVRQMLIESRSPPLEPGPADLDNVPGLVEVLNALTQGSISTLSLPPNSGLDLKRYQSHIQTHLRPFPVSLREIPPLGEDARKDLIWRFIAILFLDHDGVARIWQDGQDIMVMQREADIEGQGVSGDAEAAHGFERAVC